MSKRTERDEQLDKLIEEGITKRQEQYTALRVSFPEFTSKEMDDIEKKIEDEIVTGFSTTFSKSDNFSFSAWDTFHDDDTYKLKCVSPVFKNTPAYHKWLIACVNERKECVTFKDRFDLEYWMKQHINTFLNAIAKKWNETHTTYCLATAPDGLCSIFVFRQNVI